MEQARDRSDDNDIRKRYSSAVAFFILPFLPFFIFLPFPYMMHGPVLPKRLRLEESRQPLFLLPRHRMPVCMPQYTTKVLISRAPAWDLELLRDPSWKTHTSIFTYFPSSFSRTCTRASLDVPRFRRYLHLDRVSQLVPGGAVVFLNLGYPSSCKARESGRTRSPRLVCRNCSGSWVTLHTLRAGSSGYSASFLAMKFTTLISSLALRLPFLFSLNPFYAILLDCL